MKVPPRADGTETPDGSARLAARLSSPADDDTYLNAVALFRGAGMVVKYHDQGRVAFGDRNFYGLLAAGEARTDRTSSESDREIDRFLRFAEPPEHDEWESTENLREQYQRGFRTAIDEMFGTLRDGLRHLIAESNGSGDALTDRVLNHFPIHGSATPRVTNSPTQIFEIDSSSNFDGQRWSFTGRVSTTIDQFDGWTAEVTLTGINEDGSQYEEVPVESLSTAEDSVTTTCEDGVARLAANETATDVRFEGHSRSVDEDGLLNGKVGETQLEIRADLQTSEGD